MNSIADNFNVRTQGVLKLKIYGTGKKKDLLSRMSNEKRYKLTTKSVMKWAEHELNHVGRIVSVEDPDIQYSYAMSTLYGMLHLKKALAELVNDPAYSVQREDLQRTHDQVVRTIKHLIKDFSLDLNVIQAFNTKKILGDLSNVRPAPAPAPPAAPVPPMNTRNMTMRANGRVNGRSNGRSNGTRVNGRSNATRSVAVANQPKGLLGLGVFGL